MKILAIDDEKLARNRLERMLGESEHEFKVLGDVDEVYETLEKESFDIFILDINMPKKDGLELGYDLKYKYPNSAIIYQTAYEEHSLKAFDIGAVHYLLKPFTNDDLNSAIARVNSEVTAKEISFLTKDKEEFYLLRPDDIYYVEADLNEVMFRSDHGFSYFNDKISNMQEKLESSGFFRIHRSFLINTNKIKNMSTIEQSKIEFSFNGIDDVIGSSKDGAKSFRETFGVKK